MERRQQLSRYIIAYDGDVFTAIDEKTTHVLCGEEATEVSPILSHTHCILYNEYMIVLIQDPPDVSSSCSGVVVVSVSWLEDCLKKGKLLDTTDYVQ